jgi:serine/threonine-protein kinase RsbW
LTDSIPTRVSLKLDFTLASVGIVERTAFDYAIRAGFDDDAASDVALAAREAAINAMKHGQAAPPDDHFTAAIELTDKSIIIRIGDHGPGFDLSEVPDPLAPENILRGSGRGLLMMRAFMDEVHSKRLNPGNETTLIKYRASASPMPQGEHSK